LGRRDRDAGRQNPEMDLFACASGGMDQILSERRTP
jgi:hypothetical protein